MKDKSDNTTQTQPVSETAVPNSSPKPEKPRSKGSKGPVMVTALVAVLMAGGAIWYTQKHQSNFSQQYDAQLQLLVQQAQKNERIAQQALTQTENQAQQVQHLSTQLAHALEQLKDVSTAVQTISDSGTEVMLLNDIEQLTSLAQQQLQVGGNVANAIVSLETAQARLTQANRQSFAVLLQAINGDLDRLRTVQVIDIATLSSQLDRLTTLISEAPLYSSADQTPAQETTSPETITETPATESDPSQDSEALEQAWWQHWLHSAADVTQKGWDSLRHDLGQFISVRRVDDSAALLISPEQADRLREDLRLRITMAQLALMTKQPKVWHSEMDFVIHALENRFDGSKALTQRALALATQLADTNIDLQLPSLDNTLSVIESLKQGAVEAEPEVTPQTAVPESQQSESQLESNSSQPESTPSDSEASIHHTDASDSAQVGQLQNQRVV